jgi:ATP-binding cassette subfamily B multidrug efflux pump
MLRLFKYLKPYALLILLAVVLLFIQANADLALPDYLSKIVNNGIQQSGVENAVPDAIRQSQMDKLLLLMSADEADQTLSAYTLIEPSSPDASLYLDDFPAVADEAIYVLKDVDTAEIEALNPVMGKAFVVVSGIQRLADDPAAAEALQERLGIEIPKHPFKHHRRHPGGIRRPGR